MIFSIFDPPKNYENPSFSLPLQNPDPWDHAQMIERNILCRIALTRALYDQIRPYFLSKYFSNVVTCAPPSTAQKKYPSDHLDLPVGGKDNSGSILENPGPILQKPGSILENPGSILENSGSILENPGSILENPGRTDDRPTETDWSSSKWGRAV